MSAAAGAGVWIPALPGRAAAQTGAEGVFVLLPVGAQAVAMGEAVVALRGGTEQLWWNPAAVGGTAAHEVAIHHSQTVIGQGNALALLWPLGRGGRLGTLGGAANVLDLGQIPATEDQVPSGVIFPTNSTYSLTYGVAATPDFTVGATLKYTELRYRCSGFCADLPVGGSSSRGADVGAQLRMAARGAVTLGLAARNLGIGEGSTRPARLDLGAAYRVLAVERVAPGVELRVAAGVVETLRLDTASYRVGSDIVFDQRIHVRAGYIRGPSALSGAALGLGIAAGRLVFDLARVFGGLAAEGGKPPTYFSLRYGW